MFEARICFAISPGGPCARPKVLQAENHNPRHDAVKWDAEKKAKQPDLDQRLRRKAGENDGGGPQEDGRRSTMSVSNPGRRQWRDVE